MFEGTDQTIERWNVEIAGDATNLERALKDAASLGRQFSTAMVGAFRDVATQSRSLGDALRSLALRISEIVVAAAFKPLEKGLGSVVSGLLSGAFGFAKGGVLQNGTPVPFARGGVIRSPIAFPLSGGRTGIAGERGAEAIMPLARGPDGRLGVMTAGGAGVAVTFNVMAQDAASFMKSESQVAAMLARAVSFGQRNL